MSIAKLLDEVSLQAGKPDLNVNLGFAATYSQDMLRNTQKANTAKGHDLDEMTRDSQRLGAIWGRSGKLGPDQDQSIQTDYVPSYQTGGIEENAAIPPSKRRLMMREELERKKAERDDRESRMQTEKRNQFKALNRSQITFQYYDKAERPDGFAASRRFDDHCDFLHDGKAHTAYENEMPRGRRTMQQGETHITQAFRQMEERPPNVLPKKPAEFTPKPREFDLVVPWRRNPYAK